MDTDGNTTAKERWVLNLSERVLTNTETTILQKGLNFAVTPKEIPVIEIITATKQACYLMPNKNKADRLRGNVANILKPVKPLMRLTSLQRNVDPYLISEKIIRSSSYRRARGECLPKIHKNEVPLRPIVSSIGSITYEAATYLAVVIGPLTGKSEHHIKNSTDFVQKIKDLEVLPSQKLVSFDVSALFTSIPTDEAVRNKGTAIGSPISPIVAKLYMEHFERFVLSTTPNPPDIWYRYVDDTFTKKHAANIDSFTQHINSINPHIKFTSEQEENGKLPFLDTFVHVNEDGSTKTTVYRQPTHTDQYLKFTSNHHLHHKRPSPTSQENSTSETIRPISAGLLYVSGLSEHLSRVFKAQEIRTYYKAYAGVLVHPNDRTPTAKKTGIVYDNTCSDCRKHYMDETARTL
ncbi:uncharacterized protein LOC144642142 [Oculina patagonica]